MGALVLAGNTSGSVTVDVPAVAGSNTATFPASTGTVMVSGNQPAFSAYSNTNQTITGSTFTKVTLGTEDFDTNNNFASSRFTPTVAGYYQVNARLDAQASVGVVTRTISSLYKNGVEFKRGSDTFNTNAFTSTVSDIIYFNGSTDYIELYGYITAGTTPIVNAGQPLTYFSGCLVRGA
jgi:hypothetical protein